MTSSSKKCRYCCRRYQQEDAYKKHLQTMHLDIVLSLRAIADPTSGSPRPTAFISDGNINRSDSDYESDPGLEIADCRVACNEIDDIEHDSDTEDIPDPPRAGAHRAKKLFQELEDHSAMLITIQSSIGRRQMTPGALSRPKRTLT